jgi:putative ABC transport system substrate-binding protein
VTGISHLVSGKRLELLQQAVPGLSRVGALWNLESPTKAEEWRATEVAAQSLGLAVSSLGIRTPDDVDGAFQTARRDRLEGLVVFVDALTNVHVRQIVEQARDARLPVMSEFRTWTTAGGLMSYGPSSASQARAASDFVDRILKGGNPAEMPIEQPTEFDFVINVSTAQSLGLTIPQAMLGQVTEIIQ